MKNASASVDTKSTEAFRVSNGLDIVLDREEVYDPKIQNVWLFKHTEDIVEGMKLDLST